MLLITTMLYLGLGQGNALLAKKMFVQIRGQTECVMSTEFERGIVWPCVYCQHLLRELGHSSSRMVANEHKHLASLRSSNNSSTYLAIG